MADPRNDENLILSGLQAAMLLFHNAVLDRVIATGLIDTNLSTPLMNLPIFTLPVERGEAPVPHRWQRGTSTDI